MVIFLAIFLGLLPSFAWLIFFLKEDIHPEPKRLIALVFLAGMVVTTIAVFLQFEFLKIFQHYKVSDYSFLAFFVFAFFEEFFKFIGAYFIVRKSRYFDESIDAMIYMITSGLGFAAVENILLAATSIVQNGKNIEEISTLLVLRFIGATLLHALCSGAVGYYWAKSFMPATIGFNNIIDVKSIAKGLVIATLLHAIFNFLIITYNKMLIVPTLFIIIIALFIFLDFEKLKIKSIAKQI